MAKDSFSVSPLTATRGLRGAAIAVVFGATLALGAAPAGAALSADQVKQQVETRYGVKVLRIKPMTEQGRSAFAVTIMNPGGSFNEAFQVNTIVIDAETGRPIVQYRQGPGGLEPAAPPVSSRTSPDTASTP
jgi:hypothetical protein